MEQHHPEPARLVAAEIVGITELREALIGLGADPIERTDVLALAIRCRPHERAAEATRSRRALVAVCVLAASDEERLPDAARRLIDREVVEWATRYDEHRDDAVLRGVLALTRRPGPRLGAWLRVGRSDEHLALRAVAGRVDLVVAVDLALHWLAWPALVPATRRVIERVASEPERELVDRIGERWSLLRARSRGVALARVMSAKQLRRFMLVEGLSETARFGLVEMASWLGEAGARTLVECGVAMDPSARVRLRAVRVLHEHGSGEAADEGLLDLAYDRDTRVARAATGALVRCRSRHRRLATISALKGTARSNDVVVRLLAERGLARFDPYSSDQWQCPAMARWLLARSPHTFLDGLRDRFARVETTGSALALCRRLGLAVHMQPELIDLAKNAAEPSHRAGAALLLGDMRVDEAMGERAFVVLADLLSDADARVRASALEALSRLRGCMIRLERYAGDDSPRVRGNAVLHTCRIVEEKGSSVPHLEAMLRDERPEHRLSALWVASSVRPLAVAARVAEMAGTDEDLLVRSRARRCAIRLLSMMDPPTQEVGVA